MDGRERVLAALDGETPDRVPLALSFYHVDGTRLAPPRAWRDDAVDVGFVAFPVSAEEEELRRRAMPHEGGALRSRGTRSAAAQRGAHRPHDAPEAGQVVLDVRAGEEGALATRASWACVSSAAVVSLATRAVRFFDRLRRFLA